MLFCNRALLVQLSETHKMPQVVTKSPELASRTDCRTARCQIRSNGTATHVADSQQSLNLHWVVSCDLMRAPSYRI